jgi:hypothetical protein
MMACPAASLAGRLQTRDAAGMARQRRRRPVDLEKRARIVRVRLDHPTSR